MTLVLLRTLRALALALSPTWARRVGIALGRFGHAVVPYRRRMIRRAMARSLGGRPTDDEIRRLTRLNYEHYGQLAVEILRLKRVAEGDLSAIEFEGREHLDAALAKGRGVLVLTAHLGNYDQLAVAVQALGYQVGIISKKPKSAAVERFWMDERRSAGLKIFTRDDSPIGMIRVLKANEILGVILDQHAHVASVTVDFFGRPAQTMKSLAVLAGRSGAPVVPMFSERLPDGRHVIRALPEVELAAEGTSDEAVLANTQRFTIIIEGAVRARPEQWTWIHRRWKSADRTPLD
jgi:KDO2-lipid IV(A) lauroyltransferase